MIYTTIDNVRYGQVLGRNLYTKDGNVLLRSGVVLSVGLISRLKEIGVSAIYIKDERFNDIEVKDLVSEETRREAMSNLSIAVERVQAGKDFDINSFKKTTDNIVSEIMQNNNILVNLTDIRTKDNKLFVHSLNTCMISVLMGIHLKVSNIQLAELAIGSLLHDIGKSLPDIPENDHPVQGFNILRKKYDFNIVTAHIALQHHEHVDGSGYPRGVKGDEIPLFAKIVAVADYFDTLLAREDLKPYEACEKIMAEANSKFDLNIINVFLKSVSIYPTGSWVTLTNGDIGVVVKQHKGLPSRPVVRVFSASSKEGDLNLDDTELKDIDLANEKTIFIKHAITE
ncbi:HD-GYP domain-containing protein [Desulfuribacillus alkaliarsenatis]|uniref:Metal-dependent phosphohydrolase n=1 Tax=Desulfuribacillus alkaliarsenatis TaxID=766136 RepID=A0A1E5G0J7_9FIRM|nr:HD domain-containing phosphohydrolase [Desulfuribacillus alkaliarsenatis]OEF96355.1 metal-dependent phosphohydrolase [Desulfuribacillus alkaliarsenatis]